MLLLIAGFVLVTMVSLAMDVNDMTISTMRMGMNLGNDFECG